jgi:PKD repeat protein
VVDSSGSEFVIRDYAFNQQPYASIRAGQLSDETLVPEADFIASEDTIYVDEEITFSDQSLHHPLLYNWTFEGGVPPHSREKEQTVTYPQPGSFDVSLKVLNSQGVDSLIRQNTITVLEQPATSLNAPRDKSAFRIYPNPSNGSWSLFVPAGLHQQALTVRVYDVHGRPVMEESTSAGAPDTRFRMSHCPPGIYYVAVYNGNRILFRTALTIQ